MSELENNKIGKEKKGGFLVPFLIIVTVSCIVFSMLQTIYVLRLASGSTGIMSYTGRTENTEEVSDEDEPSERTVSPVADPEFSLERAASVTDPDKETLSTIEIARLVSPATVSIYIMQDVTEDNPGTPVFSGSGFFISEEGYLVTNDHLVSDIEEGADYGIILNIPGREVPVHAEVVGSDPQTDIAVLKADGEEGPYPCVTLGDSDMLQVGELVVAIGNPLGRLEGTVTVGVVSALDRSVNNNGYTMDLIQTDASVNSGNSGGPLINSFGEVIGVTNAKVSTAEGLGFAIPISDVTEVIESLIHYGYVSGRPYLGVTVGNVASNAYYGATAGAYVAGVDPNGPSDLAGLKEGDMIISIDGVQITSSDDIIDVRDSHEPGDEIPVVVERNGRTIELTLVVGDSNDAVQ